MTERYTFVCKGCVKKCNLKSTIEMEREKPDVCPFSMGLEAWKERGRK